MEGPSIGSCQALLLLSVKFHRQSEHNKSFNYLGLVSISLRLTFLACSRRPPSQASRSLQRLNAHRDRPQDPNHEARKRLYWNVYIWDKLIGIEGASWDSERDSAADFQSRVTSRASVDAEEDRERHETSGREPTGRVRGYHSHVPARSVSTFNHRSGSFFDLAVQSGPGPGRVLSNFSSLCRLAVILEHLMSLRTTFSSARLRDQAINVVDTLLAKWRSMLPQHLRLESQSPQPMVSSFAPR